MGFAYSNEINEVFSLLPFVKKLSPDEQDEFTTAISLLVDRDDELSNYTSGVLEGQSNSEVITTATGGQTITFAQEFRRLPVVQVCIGDTVSGLVANVVNADVTTTEFKVQVWDTATSTESNGVPVRINWIATI